MSRLPLLLLFAALALPLAGCRGEESELPDDDDVTADDDDTTPIEEDPDVVVGGTRNNLLGDDDDSTNSRGCRSGCSAGAPAPIGWGLLLLIGWRRRR